MSDNELPAPQHECGETDDVCLECCEHGDLDDFTCLDCGADLTEEIMSKAYDRAKDYWKYGE